MVSQPLFENIVPTTLDFSASPNVALKSNPSKYSGETNRNLTIPEPCRLFHPNLIFQLCSRNFSALTSSRRNFFNERKSNFVKFSSYIQSEVGLQKCTQKKSLINCYNLNLIS